MGDRKVIIVVSSGDLLLGKLVHDSHEGRDQVTVSPPFSIIGS